MLNERERRMLARIERQLAETDPDFVRLFAAAGRGSDSTVPTFLLVTGLALLVLGSLVVAVPVALTGITLSLFALFIAHTRPSRLRRTGFA